MIVTISNESFKLIKKVSESFAGKKDIFTCQIDVQQQKETAVVSSIYPDGYAMFSHVIPVLEYADNDAFTAENSLLIDTTAFAIPSDASKVEFKTDMPSDTMCVTAYTEDGETLATTTLNMIKRDPIPVGYIMRTLGEKSAMKSLVFNPVVVTRFANAFKQVKADAVIWSFHGEGNGVSCISRDATAFGVIQPMLLKV